MRPADVLSLRPLARLLARTVPARQREDAVQDAMEGACLAVRDFDPEYGCTLPSYAQHRMRGAILDGQRRLDHLSRDDRRRYADPGPPVPLDDHDPPADDPGFDRVDARVAWPRLLRLLNPRERTVVVGWAHGRKGTDLARQVGVTPMRVSQIRREALTKLRRAMP